MESFAFINVSTLEYPLHEGDIRLLYPEILESQTGDTFPCPNEFAKVFWVDPIFDSTYQYVSEALPQQLNGVWTISWVVKDMTQDELLEQTKELAGNTIELNHPGSTPNVIG